MITFLKKVIFEYFLHKVLIVSLFLIQLAFVLTLNLTFAKQHPLFIFILVMALVSGHFTIFYRDIAKMQERLENGLKVQYFTLNHTDIFPILSASLGALISYAVYHLDFIVAGMLISVVVFLFSTLIKRMPYALHNLDFSFYAGVFVGGSPLFRHEYISFWWVIAGGALAGFLFVIFKNSIIGVGGRLGTFAFLATFILSFLL